MESSVVKKTAKEPQSLKSLVLCWRFSAAPPRKPKGSSPQEYRKPKSQTTWDLLTRDAALDLAPSSLSRINKITSKLVPFHEIFDGLVLEERYLLHCYLVCIPARVYGTRPDAVFCSVRDGSFHLACNSELALQCILVTADGICSRRRNSCSPQAQSVLSRKRKLYKAMNDCLVKENVSDELLGGIIMATITESRFSNPAACRIHLQGYEQILQNRGGLENSLLRSSSKATRLAHLMPYLVCEPLEEEGSNDLEQIEDFLWFLNAELPPPVSTQLSCPGSELKDNENLPGVATIRSHEKLVSYLRPDESRISSYTDESSIFLSLYLITAGLRCVRRFSLSADHFISHLDSALRAASAVDKNTGALLLTDQGFMWVVFNVVQEDILGAAWGYTDALVSLLITSTAALKAFRKMTSKSARSEMRYLLCRALLGLTRRD